MATAAYTSGLKAIMDRTINWASDTIKIMLVTSSYTFNKDHDFVDAGGANDPVDHEIDVTGYTRGWGGAGRKTLASCTFITDDANDRVQIDAADPSAWTLGAGTTVAAACVIKEGTSNDTTSQLIFYVDFTDTATNGGTFTLSFDAAGIIVVNT